MLFDSSAFALESPDSLGPRLSHSPSFIAFGVPVFQAKANVPSRGHSLNKSDLSNWRGFP